MISLGLFYHTLFIVCLNACIIHWVIKKELKILLKDKSPVLKEGIFYYLRSFLFGIIITCICLAIGGYFINERDNPSKNEIVKENLISKNQLTYKVEKRDKEKALILFKTRADSNSIINE